MGDDIEKLRELAQEARAFMSSVRSLILSTVGARGEPEASYAPFVHRQGEGFYVYVSELSRHTANLRASGCASVLLIADECNSAQIFARTRLNFRCRAREVDRESESWCSVLDAFEAKFGEVMEMIRPLADFHLFVLEPESGTYVRGFAQAYRFVGEELEQCLHIAEARPSQ